MKIFTYGVLLGCLSLFACGGPADEAVSDEDEYGDDGYYEDEGYEDDAEGVFDPMVDTIDRAKGVEDITMDRKSQMDDAIDGAE